MQSAISYRSAYQLTRAGHGDRGTEDSTMQDLVFEETGSAMHVRLSSTWSVVLLGVCRADLLWVSCRPIDKGEGIRWAGCLRAKAIYAAT